MTAPNRYLRFVMTHPSTVLAQENAAESATALADITGVARHDVAVVLGSGWMKDTDALGETVADFPVTNLPHFAAPVAEGHLGRFRSLNVQGIRVLVFLGRSHDSTELHKKVIRELEHEGPGCPRLEALRGTAGMSRDAVYAGRSALPKGR